MLAPLNRPITDWRGRRVWIVGASSGIGAALAQQLLALGATLALSARRPAPLQALLDGQAGHLVVPMDVSDAAAVQAAHDAVLAAWGGIDVVVWVSGIYTPVRAQDFSLATARDTVDTNLLGVFNGLAAVLPTLQRQRSGHLALVASVAGYIGLPRSLAYGPTKAAMINLAESLYLDLHPQDIGVSLICPGFVETPATAVNDFKMPALISPRQAATHIVEGFAQGRFETHFPKRFTLWLKLVRMLPYRLQFAMLGRITGTARSADAAAADVRAARTR